MDTIASVASSVAAPLLRNLTYVLMYSTYLTELETEIKRLQSEEKEVRHTVEAAKRGGEEIEDTVRDWFDRVRAAVEQGQAFLQEEERERVGCMDVYLKYTNSQRARTLVEIVREVRKETFDRVSYRRALRCNVSPAAREYVAIQSRTEMLNDVVKVLKDDGVDIVGVYGMAGVGKTALVKELAWQVEKDGLFDAVVVATVTNSPDVGRIRNEIADGLGLKFDELTELGRASRLRQRIRQEQKILVVLDDMWEKLDLTKVGVPFGEDYKGCKCQLLITSRNLNVLSSNFGAGKFYRLEVLSEDESWELFEKGRGVVVRDPSIQSVAKKVAKSCGGLPLLIVTVVEELKNTDLYAWKDALEQITSFEVEGCLYSRFRSAIELSYDHLESHELKTFFLLLGSMGNGCRTRDLLVFGWCLGLHKHVDSLADGRNRLYKLIDNLRAACLLLDDGERDSVVALEVVRHVAASIASRVKPFFTVQRNKELKWPRMDFFRTCHHIFLDWCYIRKLPEVLECPNLKILQINSQGNYLKIPDDFFVQMKELKVLSLGGLNCTPSLPPSLSLLTDLQALYLCKCMLEDIATVGEITSLEILSLEKSELKELPAEIGGLSNLRLLDLTDCSTLGGIPGNVISRLTSLEELYIGNCDVQGEAKESKSENNDLSLGELKHLNQVTTLNVQIEDTSVFPRDMLSFGRLESYKILIGDGWKWSGVESENYKASRLLKLNSGADPSILKDYGIKMLMTKAEDLYLAELKGVREVLYELNDEGFSQLKHLCILNCAEMESIIGSTEWAYSDHAFPNLESLILHNLINMERICSDPLPAQGFIKLQVIKVKGCDRMEFLFSHSSLVKHLSELVEIEISECKSMTNILSGQRQEDADAGQTDKIRLINLRSLTLQCLPSLVSLSPESSTEAPQNGTGFSSQLFNDKVEFPNLETLKLYSINIHNIWNHQLSYFQNLTSLTVDGCERLTCIFSYPVAIKLVKLEHLLLSSCKLVEKIFVPDENLGHVHHFRKSAPTELAPIFPNLETFVISEMDNLISIWPGLLPQNSFCKLKKMEITSCNNLLNVFPCHVLDKLQSLESLNVWNCMALEVVYEIDGINTEQEGSSQGGLDIPLRTLSLGNLPKLKHLWNKDPQGNIRFQDLFMVKASKCKSLNYVFPLSLAKDLLHLQFLEISDCGVEEIIVSDKGGVEAALGFVFPKLVSIKFFKLPDLRCFCSGNHNLRFPLLNLFYAVECPAMETFSWGILRASILRRIHLTQEGDQWYWEGDLNTTIRKLFNRDLQARLSTL